MPTKRLISRALWAALLAVHIPILTTLVLSVTRDFALTGHCELSQIGSLLALLASVAVFSTGAMGRGLVIGPGSLRYLATVIVAAAVVHHEAVVEADAGVAPLVAVTGMTTVSAIAVFGRRRGTGLGRWLHATLGVPGLAPLRRIGVVTQAPVPRYRSELHAVHRGRGPPSS